MVVESLFKVTLHLLYMFEQANNSQNLQRPSEKCGKWRCLQQLRSPIGTTSGSGGAGAASRRVRNHRKVLPQKDSERACESKSISSQISVYALFVTALPKLGTKFFTARLNLVTLRSSRQGDERRCYKTRRSEVKPNRTVNRSLWIERGVINF